MSPIVKLTPSAFRHWKTIKKISDAFEELGYQLYLVGGCVRDVLLGRESDDLDFTTNATPNVIEFLVTNMGSVWTVGKQFGTIGVQVDGIRCEITTFRSDQYRPGDRHPEVQWGNTIEEDLARRDFTINAMAVRLPDLLLVDPYDGLVDLRQKVLRTARDPDITLKEDPLRICRAYRFSIVLGFMYTEALEMSMEKYAPYLEYVSQERKTAELLKIAQSGGALGIALLLRRVSSSSFHPIGHYWLSLPIGRNVAATALDENRYSLDSIFAAMAVDLSDPRKWFDAMRLPSAMRDHCLEVYSVVEAQRNDVDTRILIRRHSDSVLDDASLILELKYGQYVDFGSQFRDQYRGKLPVNGHDALAKGYKGAAVGKALALAESRFLLNPQITRERLLEKL